jgi:uncharacterized membrane protein|tara:strand:- start:106 stop:495 length:390 start_codon:yes stop_codon:yes gene_type:complete
MEYIQGSIIASIVILIMALIGYKFTPNTRSSFGYKTPMSLKNDSTWNFANNLAKRLFLFVSLFFIVLQIILYNLLENDYYAFNYSFLFLTIASVIIVPIIEIILNLKFDKDGFLKKKIKSDKKGNEIEN